MSDPGESTTRPMFDHDGGSARALVVPESELSFEAIHASGPGGQNINKVATAIRLTFDPASSSLLDDSSRRRLQRIAGSQLDRNGRVTILARRFRSQEQNRKDAIDRLQRMIASALIPPSFRVPTRPTYASKMRRLENKSLRKSIKQNRRKPTFRDD
jgi:ribosome-associated protein